MCLAARCESEARQRLMPFVDEGLANGEHVVAAGLDSLTGSVSTPHAATGELRVVTALVGAALAAGHPGVRLIRWMGPCAASTRRLDQQVRIEHLLDHSALLVLDEHGMRRGVVFELWRAPPDAERLVRLLELRYVRLPVEPSIHGRQESRMDG